MFIAMRNDKKQFDSPEHFRPERWLGKQQVTSNWGYGRRVCPGRFIARNSLSIGIARLLWAFNIAPKDGKAPLVEEEFFTAGFVSGPRQFDAVFTPRSEKHRMIIEHEFEAADKDVSNLLDDIRKKQFAVGLTPRA
jgi:cytochrome P450